MTAAKKITPPPLPPRPWRCLPSLTGEAFPGSQPAVFDADGRYVALLLRPDDLMTAELIALAPETLAHLVALTSVMCRLNPAHCHRHGLSPATLEETAEALDDAIALINHAQDLGISLNSEAL